LQSPDAVTAAILHQRYCLVPCNIDPGGQYGPLTSSLRWSSKRHPIAILPLLLTALLVVYLLSAYLPPLLLPLLPHPSSTLAFPKADYGWREPMVFISGSPGITLPRYLANGLNKSLVTTFLSVFPLILTSPYQIHTPFLLLAQSNAPIFKPPPPSIAFFALPMPCLLPFFSYKFGHSLICPSGCMNHDNIILGEQS
jgi:hypothetical protein